MVTAWMGDCLQTIIEPSRYITNTTQSFISSVMLIEYRTV